MDTQGKSLTSHRSGYEIEQSIKERPAEMVRIAGPSHRNRGYFGSAAQAERTCCRIPRIRSEQAGSERAARSPSAAPGRGLQ